MIDTNKAREIAQRLAKLDNLYALDELTEAAALLLALADAHDRMAKALKRIRNETYTDAVVLTDAAMGADQRGKDG